MLKAMAAYSAGYLMAEIKSEVPRETIPLLAMYPCHGKEGPVQLGPFTLELATGSPITGRACPLVVISHGSGGSHLVYRTLARHLSRNGYVVAMIEHPRNNRNINDLAGTLQILEDRPRQVRTAIDWMLQDSRFAPVLSPDRVSMIGHSLGGYTALALAGGRPTCFPNESPDGQAKAVRVSPDPGIKGIVLLAPATVWFRLPGALSAVKCPILMWTGEKDPITPSFQAELVLKGVPDRTLVDYRVENNAGHFSFLTPFPPSLRSLGFPPSQDPAGFDREEFHSRLNAGVLDFLNRLFGLS